MKDIWFIFDKNGDLLYKTTDEKHCNISQIPSKFNAQYIIKNPNIDLKLKNHTIIYNINSHKVESVSIPPIFNPTKLEIHDYIDLLNLTKQLQQELLESINELNIVKTDLEDIKKNNNYNSGVINNIFKNI